MKIKRIIPLLLLVILIGCGGDNVSLVKDGKLNAYKQTSVGDAFDAFFSNPQWEAKEAKNKTQYVEFIGEKKINIENTRGLYAIGAYKKIDPIVKIRVQFIITGDSFKIGYIGLAFKPSDAKYKSEIATGYSSLGLAKLDGGYYEVNFSSGANVLMSQIYAGGELSLN